MNEVVVTYDKPDLPALGSGMRMALMMEVSDQQTYNIMAEFGRTMKASYDAMEEQRVKMVTPINASHAAVQAFFAGPMKDRKDAISHAKRSMLAWDTAVEDLRKAEQKELDRLAAVAAKAAEDAAKKLEKKNPAAAAAIRESAAVMPVPVSSIGVEQSAGTSKRGTWKAHLVDKGSLLTYVAAHPEHTNLFDFSQAGANLIARATEGKQAIPGLNFYYDKTLAFKGAE